jgi:hypothetical protein
VDWSGCRPARLDSRVDRRRSVAAGSGRTHAIRPRTVSGEARRRRRRRVRGRVRRAGWRAPVGSRHTVQRPVAGDDLGSARAGDLPRNTDRAGHVRRSGRRRIGTRRAVLRRHLASPAVVQPVSCRDRVVPGGVRRPDVTYLGKSSEKSLASALNRSHSRDPGCVWISVAPSLRATPPMRTHGRRSSRTCERHVSADVDSGPPRRLTGMTVVPTIPRRSHEVLVPDI